ncbi:MAG: permease of phosphate ABC transporter [Roseburia sp.]|nr:permease of phosphate ABC transporter [Roseburia sp.]
MKKLLGLGNQYAKESDWTDFALVKFCLCAMGIMIGTQIPQKHKKVAVGIAACVFIATYIPLMAKLFTIAFRKSDA